MLLKKCKQDSFWSKNMMRECIRTLPREGMQRVVQCTMTTKRFFQRPREILRSEGMCNPINTDLRQCGAILSSLLHPQGCIDDVKINTDERMQYIALWRYHSTLLTTLVLRLDDMVTAQVWCLHPQCIILAKCPRFANLMPSIRCWPKKYRHFMKHFLWFSCGSVLT